MKRLHIDHRTAFETEQGLLGRKVAEFEQVEDARRYKAMRDFISRITNHFENAGHPTCPDPYCDKLENEPHSEECLFAPLLDEHKRDEGMSEQNQFEYTEAIRAIDAKIAQAIGWKDVHFNGPTDRLANRWYGVPPGLPSLENSRGGEWNYPREIPLYHADRDALAEALEWMTKQDQKQWWRFEKALFSVLGAKNKYYTSDVQAALLAPPHVVAAALAEAAGKTDKQADEDEGE
jgi:hypothetical protein